MVWDDVDFEDKLVVRSYKFRTAGAMVETKRKAISAIDSLFFSIKIAVFKSF